MGSSVRFEWDGGCDISDSNRQSLVQATLAVISGQFLGILARGFLRTIDLTMSENDGIDPFAAAHTVPIDRSDLKHLLRNHEPAAAMAAVGLNARPRTHRLGPIRAGGAEKDSSADISQRFSRGHAFPG